MRDVTHSIPPAHISLLLPNSISASLVIFFRAQLCELLYTVTILVTANAAVGIRFQHIIKVGNIPECYWLIDSISERMIN